MRKFNFKLENVLSIRESIEKEWEAKLGYENSKCQQVQNKIDNFNATLVNSKQTSVDVSQFQIKCIYEDRLSQQIAHEKKALKECEIQRDKVKEIYLEKSIDRKSIDKLKDKSIQRYKKYSLREDSLFTDEINSASRIRDKILEGVE